MSGAEFTTSPMRSEGNWQPELISIRELVSDPQFQSGYRDRLHGRAPPRFYYAEGGEQDDSCGFGYERGRAVATWLQVSGRKVPEANDIRHLVSAFLAAAAEDAVL
jgi:hypothetical protein